MSGDWQQKVTIADGHHAKVTVTPAPGATATCTILLDGRETLSHATSPAPGRHAVCESTITP